jgi:glycosyltransferase involved in cell wall biosynthesis
MKLVIQIPCLNEEATLPETRADLPKQIDGIDEIEVLIIDDGSTDRTAEVAREQGVDHILQMGTNRGLATAFRRGVDYALTKGADIVVNTDADNQYCAEDIPKLVAPILDGRAEIVVGERPISETDEFSPIKKRLQALGSWATRQLSGTDVVDAPSGFRAMTREAALQLHVFSEYTYTIETIIQAGQRGMSIISVPIRTNDSVRDSRLVKSIPSYIRRQVLTMVRIFMTYRPFRFFAFPGLLSFALGFLVGLRFVWFYLTEDSAGHVQSVILAAFLMGTGGILVLVGFLADLVSVNRKLLESVEWRMKKLEIRLGRDEE